MGRAWGVFLENIKVINLCKAGGFTVTLGIVAFGRLKTTFYSFMGVREKYLIKSVYYYLFICGVYST